MKNISRIVAVLAVGAFGIWLWLALFPSPEKVIANQFEKLAHAATVRPGEGTLPRVAGAQAVGNFFSTNVAMNIDVPGYHQDTVVSRDDLVQAVMAAHFSGGLTLKFMDINVAVAADKETAQVEATVEARVPGEHDVMMQQMKFTLRKINGKWLITRVQTVRTFS